MDGILSKMRSLLFSQRCNLRNTADVLHVTLHRDLSVIFVKIVRCVNAIPYTLRDELTCDSFQLYILRLNLKQILSFDSPFSIQLVLTPTEVIIIQSEPEKQDKNQFSEKELKLVRF